MVVLSVPAVLSHSNDIQRCTSRIQTLYLDTKNVNASEVKGTSHRRQVLILTSGGFRTAETKAILNEALLLLMIDDDGGSEFV